MAMLNASLVEILLATKDGAFYLSEQLDSLLAQTYRPIKVLVHDDGSNDETLNILEYYQAAYPDIFYVFCDNISGLGAVKNFERLLNMSTADYIMFCDQDDVWKPEKVERMLTEMQALEVKCPNLPIVVHCDLQVVDDSLEEIAPSFITYQRLPRKTKLPGLLVQNNVTGCAMILNRCAVEVSLPFTDATLMHDWWVASKVLVHGGSVYLMPQPLVMYRQHGKNTIGAKGINLVSHLAKLRRVQRGLISYHAMLRQAKELGLDSRISLLSLTACKCFSFFYRLFR